MNYLNLFRIVLFPILFLLSLIYSVVIFIKRKTTKAYTSKNYIVSVGNLQVGGTGKSPFILRLIDLLHQKNKNIVVLCKSYKALLKQPKEVFIDDSPLDVGDEALMFKKAFPSVLVFSGPKKIDTLKFAETQTEDITDKVFLIDDGSQHFKIKKNLKILIWDGSRSIFDFFSFPLGLSRENFFLSEKHDFVFLNRKANTLLSKALIFIYKKECCNLKFEIDRIVNSEGVQLDSNAVLISGVGNFTDLYNKTKQFLKIRDLVITQKIKAKDHDSFKKYNLDSKKTYVCTEKDFYKLKNKINLKFLYVIKSSFNLESKALIDRILDKILKDTSIK